jgi:hypothetical protein
MPLGCVGFSVDCQFVSISKSYALKFTKIKATRTPLSETEAVICGVKPNPKYRTSACYAEKEDVNI